MNEDLVRKLFELHKDGVYRYILGIIHDRDMAEDILQDTFVRLIKNEKLHDSDKVQAWLYKVARNCCYDILRKHKNCGEFPKEGSYEQYCDFEFFDMLSPLSENERETVTLRIVGGLSHIEIAKVTGTTVAAAKKRYERAIKKLRDAEVDYNGK